MSVARNQVLIAAVSIIAAALFGGQAFAQSAPLAPGDFIGQLKAGGGALNLILHLTKSTDGSFGGTLDSPDQGVRGIPCADFHLDGTALSFHVPAVGGLWTGTVSADGATLTGTWMQPQMPAPAPLAFARGTATPDTFVPATKPSAVDGIWLGTLQGPQTLRTQIVVRSGSKGELVCSFDSLDQNLSNVTCRNATFAKPAFSFDIPSVAGHWKGRLSDDGNTLTGTWTQAIDANGTQTPDIELNFARQQTRIAPTPPAPVTFDPAMPAVEPARLEAVLRADLRQTLSAGVLTEGKGIGATVGVVTKSGQQVFALGAARADQLFEIGSITKTFTALTLAQLIEQGKVTTATPVRELLPPGVVAKPEGREITLLDLVTQHSGLPRMPDNFMPADPDNPYADYDGAHLQAFIGKHGVARPAATGFLYSNLGFGLLGYALSRAAGEPYPQLLAKEVLQPLHLPDTVVNLTPAQQARFIPGHAADFKSAHAWDLDALAGAGAVRSTAADMLRYLEAQLDPDHVPAQGATGHTLAAALRRSHELQADAGPNLRIAYAWLHETDTGTYWHNGGTGGYTAYAFFNPEQGYAGVVLVNMTLGPHGSFADSLGQHIRQRLTGKPASSLARW
jgi:serine-type D-Ala-D-Ala carboxypeptidase/endopeptidase